MAIFSQGSYRNILSVPGTGILALITAVLILTLTLPLSAQDGSTASAAGNSSRSWIDWQKGILYISVTRQAEDQSYNRAASLYSAERVVHEDIQAQVFNALLDLQVDSQYRLRDLARSDLSLLRVLESISAEAKEIDAAPNSTLDGIQTLYSLDIFPAISTILVKHRSSFPMNEVLQWEPGSQYTGIVIYAGGSLPVHGEDQKSEFFPSLFPVIYDRNLRVVVDRNRMDPEYAARWGSAAYATDFDETPYRDRIGDNPFRISAVSLFGIVPGDPMIPIGDADILLHSEKGRELLREGRILIIYTPSVE